MVDYLNDQAEQAERLGDRHKLHQVAQSAAGVQQRQMKTVRWEDGSVTTNEAEYARCFTQHFANVLGAVIAGAPEVDEQASVEGMHLPAKAPPSTERVLQAIRQLKDCKSVGMDGIEAELLKAGGWHVAVRVQALLEKVWEYAYWPTCWRGGRLQELPKKASQCKAV